MHSHFLYSAQQPSLNRSVVRVFKNPYTRLCVVVNVPTCNGYVMCKAVSQVWKEIHQGEATLPPLYNNSVVAPQKKVRIRFIFKGLDLSILSYADDILKLSKTVLSVEDNFSVLSKEYSEIILNLNASKSEILALCLIIFLH